MVAKRKNGDVGDVAPYNFALRLDRIRRGGCPHPPAKKRLVTRHEALLVSFLDLFHKHVVRLLKQPTVFLYPYGVAYLDIIARQHDAIVV